MDDMNDFDLVPSNVDIEMAPQPDERGDDAEEEEDDDTEDI
jgi:hypothetical protein